MLCQYCRHEFSVDPALLGQTIRCPNCSGMLQISDKTVICRCPSCRTQLSVELWMLGTVAACPTCAQEVKLTLDAATSRNLFSPPGENSEERFSMKPGDTIGKYKIENYLGAGGMGEVYLAKNSFLGTLCAIKLLKKAVALREEEKQRLLREARLASSIQHSNLIAVLDADIDPSSGTLYIVMEYVDGIALDQVLAHGPMPEERVLPIIRQVAEALQAAEEMQVVHRDIKPANIILTNRGKIKLADLGIAKTNADNAEALTKNNAILGTPNYASPEQLQSSHKVDARADIYSLGATMYHMLSGQMPFTGDSTLNIITRVLSKDPRPLAEFTSVSSLTADLVHKMMDKNPDHRPANMTELIERIDRITRVYSAPVQQPIQLIQRDEKIPQRQTNRPQPASKPQPQGKPSAPIAAAGDPPTPARRSPQPPVPPAAPGKSPAKQPVRKILLICGTLVLLLGIAGAVVFFTQGTSVKQNIRPKDTSATVKTDAEQNSQTPQRKKIVLDAKWKQQFTNEVVKQAEPVIQQIPATPYTPPQPSALAQPESGSVAAPVRQNAEKYTLAGRADYAKAKLAMLRERQTQEGQSYYTTHAYEFYTALDKRLQQELNARKAAGQAAAQKNAGLLCPGGRPLTDTMQALLEDTETAADKRPEYYQRLKTYAFQIQQGNQDGNEIEKNMNYLAAQRYTHDPLIFVQSLLLFVYCDENISQETMIRLIKDLQPDFSCSKFPPEALELPEQVIVELLAQSWEEVDGITYGKSNLITELSRTGKNGRLNVINALLEAGCNIDTPDVNGLYPLHWAVRNDNFLTRFLTIAPDMQVKVNGKSVIEWGMAANILYSTARRLLQAGAPLPAIPEDQYPPNYRTLIHLAPSRNR